MASTNQTPKEVDTIEIYAVIYTEHGDITDVEQYEFTGNRQECIDFVRWESMNYQRSDMSDYVLQIVKFDNADEFALFFS